MALRPPHQGLFVGLLTLDIIYSVERLPQPNEKIVAFDDLVVAGGPATNAAIAYRHFNRRATLLAGLGHHPLARQLADDLAGLGVTLVDLTPDSAAPPPVSSILVTRDGDRAVVSLNAQRQQAEREAAAYGKSLEKLLSTTGVVLVDGHQMAVGIAVAQAAQMRRIPVVVDGGSWKPGFDQLLRHSNYAICAARFRPPGCATLAESAQYLRQLGVDHVAFTQGGDPILYWQGDRRQEIPVPQIQPVDTLGAGDIFHGAFCHALTAVPSGAMEAMDVAVALQRAASVAASACTHFGPRAWMEDCGPS